MGLLGLLKDLIVDHLSGLVLCWLCCKEVACRAMVARPVLALASVSAWRKFDSISPASASTALAIF